VAHERGITLALRLGIDSGEVVLRFSANDLGREYTALGPAVRAAARLEQLAADGTTVVTRETVRLAEGYFTTRPLERSDALALVAARPTRSRFQHVVSARRLTPFVGRDQELAALARPAERARAGHGQIVGVVGEPGIGKSRLLWEVIRSHLADGWRVMQVGAASYGAATAYLPLIDLLKGYCRIEARDDLAAVGAKLRAQVLALDPALAPDLPALHALLDVPADDPAWEALDPPRRRRQTLNALKRLLLRESREQPLALVVEDLHWIDEETRALLDDLVDSLPAARVLLLVSYRPEYAHAWGARSAYTQVRVGSLPEGGTRDLLGALLGDDPALAPVGRRLADAAEGNPLFLEECVRALAEDGALVGAPGRYRLAGPVEAIRVPSTVQAVLAARIDRLETGAKQLLQSAAVIGREVPFSLLRAVVGTDGDDLRDRLGRLQSAELLYEATLFPELAYTFKHALTHDVAYGSLLQERRRALHARVVRAMERSYAGRLVEVAERLAYHALRGELWEEALCYARQAGGKAAARSAHREAAIGFDQALLALRRLPETPALLQQAIDIRLEIRSALYPLGEFEQIVTRLREAETIAEALHDRGRLARVAALLASLYFTTGRYEPAIEAARRTRVIGEATGALGDRVLGNHYLGLAFHSLGQFPSAIELLTWNVEALTGDRELARFGLHGVAVVFSLSPLVWSLAEVGDFPTALARSREQLRIAESADHPYTLSAACIGNGLLHLRLGNLERAMAIGERGLGVCRTWENRTMQWVSASQLGYAQALSGRLVEGIATLSEAVDLGDALQAAMNHALAVGWLGEALLLADGAEEAAEQANRSLGLARERGERGAEAWAVRLQAEIASHQGPATDDRAEWLYRRALALADELGMRPLQAHCHLGLGKLYRRTGRPDEARAELQRAVAMLREMGMVHWLPEAEAEADRVALA
jgi:tetratricopeptide (TPR) repeat protein